MKIIAIGNAIVDILSQTDDSFLSKNKLVKGSMSLIDNEIAENLAKIDSIKIDCGGSAANTISAISQLGIESGFIGKVSNDLFGKKFIEKITENKIKYLSKTFHNLPTAKSFILISDDAQRTMCTYLGCASEIDINDIDSQSFNNTDILYLEGYLWDKPSTVETLKSAIKIAKENNTKIAFTLSDSFCVTRHKSDFLDLIKNDLDILFCNEAEFLELLNSQQFSNESALNFFKKFHNLTTIITRSEKGCVIIKDNILTAIPASHIANIIDSTGAGDSFAAGFLYQILKGQDLIKAAKFGNLLAATIIQKFGARFEDEEIRNLYEKIEKTI